MEDVKIESKDHARRAKVLEAQLNKVQEKFEKKETELSEIMFKEKEKLNQMISDHMKTGQLHELLKSKEQEIQKKNEEIVAQRFILIINEDGNQM